jgi:hypothetical protein
LSLGILAAVFSVIASARFAQLSPNPFSDYADILPGQARSALVLRRFSCAAGRVTNDRSSHLGFTQYCVLQLGNGLFDHIGVMVSDNAVNRVFFSARENALTVGDLVFLWGRPPMIARDREQMTLAWSRGEWTILANTKGTRLSYLMPLRRVVFIAASY